MDQPKILIIEDNPISRKALRISLEVENYTVVESINGHEGLEEAKKQKFELIIQDLFLPDIEGFELNNQLRALPGFDKIPIFALSGFLNPLEKHSEHTGFTTFLLKPIVPSYLLDVVKAHLPISSPSKVAIGKGKHILIADDNAIQLKLFSMQLRNLGFEVTTALDGVIALKEATIKAPDAIISDILMPNMDGFSLCLEIKRDPKLAQIPVMLLTSHYLEDEDLTLAKKVGASCYLTRTPSLDKLISELMRILTTKIDLSSAQIPTALTEGIKEKHAIRSIRQLEQQVLDNAKLAQRCAMLMSQLSLIGGIANALTSSDKNRNVSLKEVLYFFLDATGISKGALYIKNSNNVMQLSQQIGYPEEQKAELETFFGESSLINEIIKNNDSFAMPSEEFSGEKAKRFLDAAKVKSALFIPLFSGLDCLGLLFLDSNLINFSGENTKEFVRTLGMQFGQSIALASAFDNLASSEKRYRQLVEISPDAIFIQQDEKFVYANSAALKLVSAKTDAELLNHKFYDFFSPDYQKIVKDHIEQNKTQNFITHLEVELVNLNGESLEVEIVFSSILFQDKPATYLIMRDVTERKRFALQLEIQYAIAWTLAESATLFVATAKILKIICERLNWDCGTIWAVDKVANVLRCSRVWQSPQIRTRAFEEESQSLSCAPGVGQIGQVWVERKAVWTSNIMQEKSFLRKASVSIIGLNTAVVFPIIYENEVLGIIEFFSKRVLKPDFALLLWFESIGNQFGLFLKRKHMESQMLYLAEHDILTGLSNRSLLEQYLNTAILVAKENKQKLAILFLDLDNFKYVNDSMGHEAGDLLLKEISERFRLCLRPEDTISRLGGDEFVIILPNLSNKEDIIEIIIRLQSQLSREIALKEKNIFITASIGVSLYPDNGDNVQNLIKIADIAMYAAKEKGRNNFQFASTEMIAIAENRGVLQNNIRLGLENNEFVLYYQPKIDVATQKISGMEALIRWKRPEGILLPAAFIAAAEGSDLIIPMGEWVLKTAFLQNKEWQNQGLPAITMSVNLSVRNLNRELLQLVEKTIAEVNLQPHTCEVELTESVLMSNVENNIQILKSLKEMGIKISIDDFGTGYSSLSYLKRFPIDTLKIDQSFVRDLAKNPDDAAIVTAIIAMAHSLGFRVIAEGVETEAQLKFLCDHNCDEIQGYYFSRPLPENDATQFIQNAKIAW